MDMKKFLRLCQTYGIGSIDALRKGSVLVAIYYDDEEQVKAELWKLSRNQ